MKSYFKDIFRTIKNTFGRFMAIMLIVGLGSGFYASLRMVSLDMNSSADKYYDDTNLYDLRVVGTAGLNQEDINALKDLDGVEDVQSTFESDIVGTLNSEQITMRIMSFENDDKINSLELVSGDMPKSKGECVISDNCIINVGKNIGDVIHIDEATSVIESTFSTNELKIVGTVRSSNFVAFASLGTTTLGSGELDDYVFVAPETFSTNFPITEAFITVQGAKDEFAGSAEYNKGIDNVKNEIDKISKSRCDERYDELVKFATYSQMPTQIIEKPEWLVMDRTKNQGVESFKSDAERIDNIAKLFPLIFFLVAALVALTTMTRMIDEERLAIGTYKALGYGRALILTRYLVYAFLASAIGSIIGTIVLSQCLPSIIIEAYSILYYMPHDTFMPIDFNFAFWSCFAGVAITLLATIAATFASLKESTANLLRPKVDSKGKRILLERISFIWKKLSFSKKVTFRNIARYKKRSLMTVIGIAGCTGLLLTGFGLNNSINDIIDKQFGNTVLYNCIVTQSDDSLQNEDSSLFEKISNSDDVKDYAQAHVQSMVAIDSDDKELSLSLIIPNNPNEFKKVWKTRDRKSKQELHLTDDGILINEKLANMLQVNIGDEITLANQDKVGNASSTRKTIKISGIFENYVSNYCIGTKEFYENLFDEQPTFETFYITLNDSEPRQQFAEEVKETNEVKTIEYNDEVISTYKTSLKSVNMVVAVLVVCAALLAFVVLYNLNNINICERKREIATLQVLGFRRREVEMYIYRETIILTLIGIIVGLIFGIFLESFVVVSAEVDYVMFGRDIHGLSFVVAAIITLLFSGLIMFFMRNKFDKVDMVESLKSNE